MMIGTSRAAAAVIATAVLALMAAACGDGGSSSTGSGGAPSSPSAVAYSACMRSHGVPNFPDPVSGAAIPKADPRQLGVSTARLEAAQRSCQQLIPGSGDTAEQQQEAQCAMAGQCPQAVVQQWMSGLRTLAQCLRTHGEPNWPDPVLTAAGLPHFNYDQAGIDHHAPRVLTQVKECMQRTGFQGLPLP